MYVCMYVYIYKYTCTHIYVYTNILFVRTYRHLCDFFVDHIGAGAFGMHPHISTKSTLTVI
jgi:hypothetical protein